MVTQEWRRRAGVAMLAAAIVLAAGCAKSQVIDFEPASAPKGVTVLPRPYRSFEEQQAAEQLAQAQEALDEGRFSEAEAISTKLLDKDRKNAAARGIREQAVQAQKRKAWREVVDSDNRSRESERLRMREKQSWPDGVILYPDKETWKEIESRTQP